VLTLLLAELEGLSAVGQEGGARVGDNLSKGEGEPSCEIEEMESIRQICRCFSYPLAFHPWEYNSAE
jgi:hypothetical protein